MKKKKIEITDDEVQAICSHIHGSEYIHLTDKEIAEFREKWLKGFERNTTKIVDKISSEKLAIVKC